jgi:hypothetical protein
MMPREGPRILAFFEKTTTSCRYFRILKSAESMPVRQLQEPAQILAEMKILSIRFESLELQRKTDNKTQV